jgi:hypothetical protein
MEPTKSNFDIIGLNKKTISYSITYCNYRLSKK